MDFLLAAKTPVGNVMPYRLFMIHFTDCAHIIKLQEDWKIVVQVVPEASFSTYIYHWLVVNSRSFYYEIPGFDVPASVDDRMVMCPFVDYFNHQDHGVG